VLPRRAWIRIDASEAGEITSVYFGAELGTDVAE
jgi:hypothetical protein